MADNIDDAAVKAAAEKAVADKATAEAAEATRLAEEEAARARAAINSNSKDADMIEKLVNDRLDTRLADIKGKLDNAFKARDEALVKIAEFERKEKEATLKKLEEDGKHKEAYELRLAEERAANEALRKQNTELSRDVAVRDALKGYTFRNDKANDMAFKEIISNLVQNESGAWVHRSGISIKDYCDAFSKDDDQAFLFKAKSNSGGGSSSTNVSNGSGDTGSKSKSLFAMSQAEVLKMAAEGKLGQVPTF